MSQIKYISVIEYTDDGNRLIVPGKSNKTGTNIRIPTDDNGLENMTRLEWERVGVFTLPEPMAKSAFKEWWNDHKDDDPQPDPIPEVLAVMEGGEVEA